MTQPKKAPSKAESVPETTEPETGKDPEAASETKDEPVLERGDLVSYVTVTDFGHDRTDLGIVVDVFDVGGNPHAQVAPLVAPQTLDVTRLTPFHT